MASMTVTEARAALPQLLTRVEHGDEITITRHGRAIAVLVRPDVVRRRKAGGVIDSAAHIHELVAEAGTGGGGDPSSGLTLERAQELISAIRDAR